MSARNPSSHRPPTLAIIGGGYTGAALVAHLTRGGGLPDGVRIVVVEPRDELGRGLAYGTDDPAHRVNVPAGKMTLFPDCPSDFQDFIDAASGPSRDADLVGRDGQPYPQRSVFGDYMAARLGKTLRDTGVEHWRTHVTSVRAEAGGYSLRGEDGRAVSADLIVLAVSHPSPALPRVLAPFRDDAKLIADVTRLGALDPIDVDDRILIIGNGLTSADVVASLARRGHRGPLTSISRRGLRSRGHGPAGQEAYGDFVTQPAKTASALLRRVRRQIAAAQAEGFTWHSVLDALRAQGQDLWAILPLPERRRIVQHLRPYWDVHRFRIAPQVEDVIDAACREGRLDILAASVAAVEAAAGAYRVQLRQRHQSTTRPIEVDAIVVTTGPAHGNILTSQAFLGDLEAAGILQPCPTGLGIACDRNGHPVGRDAKVSRDILIAGPLARGTFGELMGLPQVTDHAIFIADRVRSCLQERQQLSSPWPKAS
ncbi:Uncharacterized NAD(P)/FAD-binding protein YdhS [Rhizobium sp. RU20A]|uniref:FAD/NAD(P)-binding protein n=1 Tax=Rhizobium sp. RU20A TaxID=1907412 RepID=UPI0009565607|nr:FAD/NAD(P)-binding protein [Rhizobium sp. RU20A]SIR23198.1 Uncharacterized NAD(P)/FAD-binding protein YdhS [Rhizobium sp. RU20A]